MSVKRMTELIEKKRRGEELKDEEIQFFINLVTSTAKDDIKAEHVQIGAMLMAMFLQGLGERESSLLTTFMGNSGHEFAWNKNWQHLVVDKHSTGGVGDKISLVLAPALAALGLKVPMISGRSLGHTGGTLDKLESIPGFRVELSVKEIIEAVEKVGCCIVGQTSSIVPADRILYQCRDLTSTVRSESLIVASIVSKKLAEGTSALVYDVKYGTGSALNSKEEALNLAKSLILATSGRVKCSALLTKMDSPIGYQVGNSLEVIESVECLRGGGPEDVIELVEGLGAELLCLTGLASDFKEGKLKIGSVLKNGQALKKFHQMVLNQGVSDQIAKELCFGITMTVLPSTRHFIDIEYEGPNGYIVGIDAKAIAEVARKEMCRDKLCLASGITMIKHVGDYLKSKEDWLRVYHNWPLDKEALKSLNDAIQVSSSNEGSRKRLSSRITLENGEIKISKLEDTENGFTH